MIDYKRLKDAINVTLSNPQEDEEGKLKSIDVSYQIFDEYSGQVLQTKNITLKKQYILDQKSYLADRRQGLMEQVAKLQSQEDSLQELIDDAMKLQSIKGA